MSEYGFVTLLTMTSCLLPGIRHFVVILDSRYTKDHLELTGRLFIVRCVRHDRGKEMA